MLPESGRQISRLSLRNSAVRTEAGPQYRGEFGGSIGKVQPA